MVSKGNEQRGEIDIEGEGEREAIRVSRGVS